MDDPTGPSTPIMLARGMRRRCPMCGAGSLFTHWFRICEHCPRCGMRFEREEGTFVGGMFINIALTEIALALFIVVGFALTLPDPPVGPMVVGAVFISILVPTLGYPFSKTIWAAVHLAMQPLEPAERAEAATARFQLDWEREHPPGTASR